MSALINLVLSCRWFFFLSFFELHQFLRNCRHTKLHLIHLIIPFFLLFEKNYYLGKIIKSMNIKYTKKCFYHLKNILDTYPWSRVHYDGQTFVDFVRPLTLKIITVSTSQCAKSRSYEQTKIHNTIIRFI